MGCRELDISDCFIFSTEKDHSAAHFEYSPFGKIISENRSMPEKFAFRFSSEYNDSETGLVYYNYRYYDADMGRWINRDPIGEAIVDRDKYSGTIKNIEFNLLYGFVNNDAVNFWDYIGLEKLCITIYARQPVKGKLYYRSGANFGHAFVKVTSIENSKNTFTFGFYPKEPWSLFAYDTLPQKGNVANDEKSKFHAKKTYRIDSKKTWLEVKTMANGYSNENKYLLWSNNCVVFALAVAKYAGVSLPANFGRHNIKIQEVIRDKNGKLVKRWIVKKNIPTPAKLGFDLGKE